MKRLLLIALSVILVLSMLATLIACDSDKKSNDDDDEEEEEEGELFENSLKDVRIPEGWIKAYDNGEPSVDRTVSYVNTETGESIVIQEKLYPALEPEDGADIGEPDYTWLETDDSLNGVSTVISDKRIYKYYIVEPADGYGAEMYCTQFVFISVPNAENELETLTVIFAEVDSECPLANAFEDGIQ